MTPQDSSLAHHLQKVGSITAVEASTLYKIRSLTSNIWRLRALGMEIMADRRRDITGQRYVRYHLGGGC